MEDARAGTAVPLASRAYAVVKVARLVVRLVRLAVRETLEATSFLTKPKIGTTAYNNVLQKIFSFCSVYYIV